MRQLPLDGNGLRQVVLADASTTYTLPYPPQVPVLPMNFEVVVDDNLGVFTTTTPMVVTGPIAGTTVTTASLSTASSRTSFQWVGDRYLQK